MKEFDRNNSFLQDPQILSFLVFLETIRFRKRSKAREKFQKEKGRRSEGKKEMY